MRVLMTTVPAEAGGGIANLHQLIAQHNDCLDLVFCAAASRSPFREPLVKRSLRSVLYCFKVASLLIGDPSIKVVHVNTAPDNKAVLRDALIVFAATLCGRKTVVQIHGGVGDYRRAGIVNLLAKAALHCSDAVLVFSTNDKRLVDAATGNPQKSRIIANAVAVKDFAPGAAGGGTGERELVVLFLSRLIAEKGVYELIAAIESVVAGFPAVRFVFAGDGPERRNMEEQCRKRRLENRVSFTGHLGYPEVVRAYREADLFVLPSYSEAMPMTILQALAAGLPIVSTRCGAVPEMLQDGINGFLVPARESSQLAEKILAVLRDDALREAMSRANRDLAWESYDIAVLMGQLKRLYLALAERPGRAESAA